MKAPVLFLVTAAATALLATGYARSRDGDVVVVAMGPHMDMTVKRPLEPGDQARADAILAALAPVMHKYKDVNVAIADGFKEFHPELHLVDAHFTNKAYALEAWFGHFDPSHPTSLMYHRTDHGWVLQGAMYTASRSATQAQLDADVPMSIGRWHRHTNFCIGPLGSTRRDYVGPGARFGLAGSIHDRVSCVAANGYWKAWVFGWMLHVWPMQTDPAKIWALHPNESGAGDGAMEMKMP